MSDNFWKVLCVAMTIGAIVGMLATYQRGRAEQKQEDAAWYAAHPVVKEVPSGMVRVIKQEVSKDGRTFKVWIDVPNGWKLEEEYPPPPKPKGSKGDDYKRGYLDGASSAYFMKHAQPLPEKEPAPAIKWILCADPMDPHRLVPCPDLTAEEKCKWITDCAAPLPAENRLQ